MQKNLINFQNFKLKTFQLNTAKFDLLKNCYLNLNKSIKLKFFEMVS